MGLIEEQLESFFSRVGHRHHARNILFEIDRYIPMMLQYPYIVERLVSRFGMYFTATPADNHSFALKCLIRIAYNVPSVRPRIIEHLGPVLYEYYPIWIGTEEFALANKLLEILELPLSEADQKLRDFARSTVTLSRSFVLVVGAGFSYDTMPITRELEPLMITLLREAGVSSPKELVEADEEKAWAIIKENCRRFKDMFSGRCSNTKHAPQHKVVARMFNDGHISHIISLNWDILIEKAYREEYGEDIPKIIIDGYLPEIPSLWKLHGDVGDLSSEWVFPYEKGRVFKSLLESLERNTRDTQFALIIGYSEYEDEVREKLIKWLEGNIPNVFRVRPNWDEADVRGIRETSRRFFERLNIYFKLEAKAQT